MEDHCVRRLQRRAQLPGLRGDSRCVCVCVCVRMCVLIFVYVFLSLSPSLSLSLPMGLCVCLLRNVWVKFHARIATRKLIKVVVRVYLCVCVCVSVHRKTRMLRIIFVVVTP